MSEVSDRFLQVVLANTQHGRRASQLATLTEIPSASWQKALEGKQKPTLAMLQAVAQLWPEYAFWTLTGITDARNGHLACVDGSAKSFYPERDFEQRSAANAYFRQVLEMYQRRYGEGLTLHGKLVLEYEDLLKLHKLEVARLAESAALSKFDDAELEREIERLAGLIRQEKEADGRRLIDMAYDLRSPTPDKK